MKKGFFLEHEYKNVPVQLPATVQWNDWLVTDTPFVDDVPKTPVFVRSENNYDMDFASEASGIVNEEPSMTQQQFKEESDINTIVKRFMLTGEVPENYRAPQYGDYTDVPDFQTAMNIVRDAASNFLELPAELRARFVNDPQALLEFVGDENNRAEAIELGLLPKPPAEPIVDAPAPAPEPPA